MFILRISFQNQFAKAAEYIPYLFFSFARNLKLYIVFCVCISVCEFFFLVFVIFRFWNLYLLVSISKKYKSTVINKPKNYYGRKKKGKKGSIYNTYFHGWRNRTSHVDGPELRHPAGLIVEYALFHGLNNLYLSCRSWFVRYIVFSFLFFSRAAKDDAKIFKRHSRDIFQDQRLFFKVIWWKKKFTGGETQTRIDHSNLFRGYFFFFSFNCHLRCLNPKLFRAKLYGIDLFDNFPTTFSLCAVFFRSNFHFAIIIHRFFLPRCCSVNGI